MAGLSIVGAVGWFFAGNVIVFKEYTRVDYDEVYGKTLAGTP